jgi:xanthine dehydrogenase YagS FAD-binding subunit
MKNFRMAQPQSLAQAAALLADGSNARLLMAGGTDLLDMLKSGVATPDLVIDLSLIPGLSEIRSERDRIRIGALTRVADLADSPLISDRFPILRQAALSLATPQLRNVGTVAGNLCQRPRCWYFRDPEVECRKKGGSRCYAYRGRNRYHAILGGGICYIVAPSDLAPALISLGAEVTVTSTQGDRTLALEDFYALPSVDVRRETVLKPGELVKDVSIPVPGSGAAGTYLKLKERGTWDFAVVSVAFQAETAGRTFKKVSIVCGGIAPVPWRLAHAERQIQGGEVTEERLREAARKDLAEARPLAENAHKVDLLETAVARAGLSLLA